MAFRADSWRMARKKLTLEGRLYNAEMRSNHRSRSSSSNKSQPSLQPSPLIESWPQYSSGVRVDFSISTPQVDLAGLRRLASLEVAPMLTTAQRPGGTAGPSRKRSKLSLQTVAVRLAKVALTCGISVAELPLPVLSALFFFTWPVNRFE